MIEQTFPEMSKALIEKRLETIKKFIDQYIEPLSVVAQPEKVIGKPYGEWMPEDEQRAQIIYGAKPDSVLARGLARHHIEQMRKVEEGT
jgi:hypothetical protein